MSINVCQSIKCPWFAPSSKRSYGCQRWPVSSCCHLLQAHRTEFSENEYALYADAPSDQALRQWKAENDRFCLEDPKYADDRKFQADFPECFEDDSFKVGAIASGVEKL